MYHFGGLLHRAKNLSVGLFISFYYIELTVFIKVG